MSLKYYILSSKILQPLKLTIIKEKCRINEVFWGGVFMNENKSLKHQFKITLFFAILNLLLIAFIFIHSLTPADISQEESGAVTDWLSYVFPFELS